jgi:dephospho-CoA kinase
LVIVGLTGGIASGKSAVSEILSGLGATVIDADKVGHEAFHPGSDIWRGVVAVFGEAILGENGEIDRGKLADIVFRDPEALERLNGIMHPKMYEIVKEKIEAMRAEGNEVVVLEAALLIEAGWTDLVDQVWVVVAPESVVIDRLRQQKGFTREQAEARIKAQTTASQKVTSADVVITNDSDLESLRGKIEKLWRSLK